MPGDFVNRGQYSNRRNRRFGASGGTQIIEKEIMLVPTYDTFIFNNPPGYSGGDRWDFISNGSVPSNASELPIGLYNPWNDQVGNATSAPRTPTRTIMGFNLSEIPLGVNILSADLNITVARTNAWNANPNPGLT